MNSRSNRKGTNASDSKGVYAQEYDDEENAADIEDADRVEDDDDDRSGSLVRKPVKKIKNGVYKEDYNTGGSGITSGGAGALNGADLKKKFHFQIS